MHAIYFDILFAMFAVVLGSTSFCSRMSLGNRCVNSPFLEIAIICLGSMSWLVFGFLAVSALMEYGGLHSAGYRGHWGYTLGRLLAFLCWLAMLYKIRKSLLSHDKKCTH